MDVKQGVPMNEDSCQQIRFLLGFTAMVAFCLLGLLLTPPASEASHSKRYCSGELSFGGSTGTGPVKSTLTSVWKYCTNRHRITKLVRLACNAREGEFTNLVSYYCRARKRSDGGYTIKSFAKFRTPRTCVLDICTPSKVLTVSSVVGLSRKGYLKVYDA